MPTKIYSSKQQKRGVMLIALYVFILFAAPRAGVRLGPAPIYFLDAIAGLIIFYAGSVPALKWGTKVPFAAATGLLWMFIVLSEIRGLAFGAETLDAAYLLVRTTLGMAVMFAIPRLIHDERHLIPVFKAVAAAIVITSILMIASSLPMTRSFVTDTVFSQSFLEPSTNNVTQKYLAEVVGQSALRGRSLVGVSIMSATFINIAFPFIVILMLYRSKLSGFWRRATLAAVILGPAAVLLSYSRGPILGFIMLFIGALVLNWKRFSNSFLVPASLLALAIFAVGAGSEIFMFDRLQTRTEAMFNDPFADERESERILAYSEPFTHLANNPRFTILGEGNAIRRSDVSAENDDKANHALFATSYYSYGLIAAVLFHLLILHALWVIYSVQSKRNKSSFGGITSQALLLSMVAFLPWAAFGHAIASEARGTFMLFLILGLISAVSFMPGSARQKRPLPVTPGNSREPAAEPTVRDKGPPGY